MIDHDAFAIEPWALRQVHFSPVLLAQAESLFALSNGFLGLRGNLEEGEPTALHGTYLNGFFERRPSSYPERGVGDPAAEEILVNVTDGKRLHLMVGDDPLDVRTGEVLCHERTLDLRAGVLTRVLHWRSPAGAEVRLRSRRLVSLAVPELAAIQYEVEPVTAAVRLTLHSDLVTDETNPISGDPRGGTQLPPEVLLSRLAEVEERRVTFVHETSGSALRVAAGMHNLVDSGGGPVTACACEASFGRFTLIADAAPGAPLRLTKLLAYHWSAQSSPQELAAAVKASLDDAVTLGWHGLAERQRGSLDSFWATADVELDGDPEIQQALRFSLFHLFQASVHAAGRAIPAKGLTGPGYNGHAFWDTETFVLPVLTYTVPPLAREALRWRAATLEHARAKARTLGHRGAAFAWRTISGPECSTYFPAGNAAFHVNADIADAVVRYLAASDDEDFARHEGAALLSESARLWMSLGFHDERRGGRFCLHGVTGPDEYSALVDNNLYTNLMAQANLRAAADLADRLGADAPDADPSELAAWRAAADTMAVPYDEELGVHLQDEQFAEHEPWDFATTPPERYPLLMHFPYLELYRRQVVKQPDLVLAMHLCSNAFTPEQKQRNFAHYEPLTVRDSSLAACTNAVLASELGHLELAHDYLAEATLMDLHDLERNSTDGLHLASLAGGWIAAINGLAGLRDRDRQLRFAPRLPAPLTRLAFTLIYRGRSLKVEVAPDSTRYLLGRGEPFSIIHHGKPQLIHPATPIVCANPPPRPAPPPLQPPGRAPARPRRLTPAYDPAAPRGTDSFTSGQTSAP
jgi:alpha,alpha-trehalose phosphorylase